MGFAIIEVLLEISAKDFFAVWRILILLFQVSELGAKVLYINPRDQSYIEMSLSDIINLAQISIIKSANNTYVVIFSDGTDNFLFFSE